MQCEFQYEAGHRLDSFTIAEGLFCGALSEVYRGTDTLTHQPVAIKVPSLDIINNPLVYYHYQNELQVLGRNHHPGIVRLIRRDRTSPYSVFDYIDGRDLYSLMKKEGPLALDAARRFLRQIGKALSYIHDCGIIHMDIKPENVIVTRRRTVKLVDFGLARRLGSPDVLQEDFTRPHGTPYYAAPEQLERYRDDPRTDLYSLALVGYEMLTGQLPFERTRDLSRVRRRLKKKPVPPRTYRPEIPKAVEAVLLKALERDPADRYPTVEAFVVALDAADRQEPHEALLSADDPPASQRACPVRPAPPHSEAPYRHILAALDDNDQAEAIVETALLEALNEQVAVTLLTVVDGSGDDDWSRYGDEVKGNRWGRRLEAFARRFRRFGIEPTVRIQTGSPPERIVETARRSKADLIILGVSNRAWYKRIFGGRTLDRVIKKAPCQVSIADVPLPSEFPWEAEPSTLSPEALEKIDRYLASLWTRQLNWLATFVQRLLAGETAESDPDPLAGWIADLQARTQWRDVVDQARDAHRRFVQVVDQIRHARAENDLPAVGRLYRRAALPALCRLRSDLEAVSAAIRRPNTAADKRPARILEEAPCPIEAAGDILGPTETATGKPHGDAGSRARKPGRTLEIDDRKPPGKGWDA
ncbi:MAG TPA: bifunctional serine/threonine-protein kinase/universal stress protein [Desulfosarcina sp.]|nr:bifunctional serine/threonine-protein kinase/universal stress protein [Desulfosarcina sp.]